MSHEKKVRNKRIVRLRDEKHLTWKAIGVTVDLDFSTARKIYLRLKAKQ